MSKTNEMEGLKVYELGVQIVSDIDIDAAGAVFADLKAEVEKKGTVISEEAPKLRELAYTMEKHLHGKNIRYSTAYFAWVKFETNPEEIANLDEVAKSNTKVLRYIIVKTVKENTLHGHKFAAPGKHEYKKEASKDASVEAEIQADDTEVEKAIDEMVTE